MKSTISSAIVVLLQLVDSLAAMVRRLEAVSRTAMPRRPPTCRSIACKSGGTGDICQACAIRPSAVTPTPPTSAAIARRRCMFVPLILPPNGQAQPPAGTSIPTGTRTRVPHTRKIAAIPAGRLERDVRRGCAAPHPIQQRRTCPATASALTGSEGASVAYL